MTSRGKSNAEPAQHEKSDAEHRIESLLAQIERVKGDIDFIDQQRGVPKPSKRTGPKGPRTIKALEAKLGRLNAELSHKHTAWLQERGEQLYRPPFDKLLKAGIVSPPSQPEKRGRGRPRGGKGDRLVALTAWLENQGLKTKQGKPVRGRSAIVMATDIQHEFAKRSDPKKAAAALYTIKRNGLPAHHQERRYHEAKRRSGKAQNLRSKSSSRKVRARAVGK